MPTLTNEISADPHLIDLITSDNGVNVPVENFVRSRRKIASRSEKNVQPAQRSHTAEHTRAELPKNYVPIWEKSNLTLEEGAAYFGIGTAKLRELTNDKRCDCVIFVGSKRLIKRKKFEKFLETAYSI